MAPAKLRKAMRKSLLTLVLLVGCDGKTSLIPLAVGGDVPAPWALPPTSAMAEAPLRRLTAAQYQNSVLELFAPLKWTALSGPQLPGDETAGPFLTNGRTSVSASLVDVYFSSAQEIAKRAVAEPQNLLGCAPSDDCANSFLQRFARRVYRRDLSEEESAALKALYTSAATGQTPMRGVEVAIAGLLSSPHFLYFVESRKPVEKNGAALDGFSVATRLAFFLYGSAPDEAMLAAAQQGKLDTAEGVAEGTWQMLKDDRVVRQLENFTSQWLGLEPVSQLSKDSKRYPFFTPEVRGEMQRETRAFVDTVIRRSDGRFETLLSAPFSFPGPNTLRIYGLQAPVGFAQGTAIGLDAKERKGILQQAAFLAAHANPKLTSPVHRGVFLLSNVMCRELGSPPADVDLTPIEFDPSGAKSRRQLLEERTAGASCRGCHSMINPLGLAFESYDAVGLRRQVDLDDGLPVDTSVVVSMRSDIDGVVQGPVELVDKIARSQDAARCHVTQWFRFAMGRKEADSDQATLEALQARFAQTRGSIPDLIVAITSSDSFRSAKP